MNAYAVATMGLPPMARLAIPVLERLAKGHDTCLSATRTIAAKLNCSERTARNALNALQAAGLVEIVRDYSLRTRRRIVLVWRTNGELVPCVTANPSAESRAASAVTDGSPPIINISEEVSKKQGVSDGSRAPVPPPPSRVLSENLRGGEAEATPDEIASVAARAAPVLRLAEPAARAKVAALAKRWGLPWVVAALGRAEKKAALEPLVSPSAYLVRTLKGFEAEGGPGAAPLTQEEFLAARDAAIREQLDRADEERAAFLASLAEAPAAEETAEPRGEPPRPALPTADEVHDFVLRALVLSPEVDCAALESDFVAAAAPAVADERWHFDAASEFRRATTAMLQAGWIRRRGSGLRDFLPPFFYFLPHNAAADVPGDSDAPDESDRAAT